MDEELESVRPESVRSRPSALEKQLHYALLILLRHTRGARKTNKAWVDPLIDDLHQALTAILEEHGVIHLRVGVDGFSHGPHKVLDYSPRDDAKLFSLFQYGVRQLSFLPGLRTEELHGLIEVLNTDLTALAFQEEDITTLLLSKDLSCVEFVVVETFSESESSKRRGSSRAEDIAKVVADALSQSIDPDRAGAGSFTFWKADVTFFKEQDVAELIATLPNVTGTHEAKTDAFAPLREEMDRRFGSTAQELPRSTIEAVRGTSDEVTARLAGVLGGEWLRYVAGHGLDSIAIGVQEIISWLEERRKGSTRTRWVAEQAFNSKLQRLALRTLDQSKRGIQGERGELATKVALAMIAWTSANDVPGAFHTILRQGEGLRREDALAALMSTGHAFEVSSKKLLECDEVAALAILQAVRNESASPGTVQLFGVARTHPSLKVRVQALSWFAYHGGPHAVRVLGEALRDISPEVRTTSLCLVTRTQSKNAAALVKVWIESEEFERLEYEEKRLAWLLMAKLYGDHGLAYFREVASHRNLMRRAKLDERRAAAVAALGFLVDTESFDSIEQAGASRSSGAVLRDEAHHVIESLRQGDHPYPDPVETLEGMASALDLSSHLISGSNVLPEISLPTFTNAPTTARSRTSSVRAPAWAVTSSFGVFGSEPEQVFSLPVPDDLPPSSDEPSTPRQPSAPRQPSTPRPSQSTSVSHPLPRAVSAPPERLSRPPVSTPPTRLSRPPVSTPPERFAKPPVEFHEATSGRFGDSGGDDLERTRSLRRSIAPEADVRSSEEAIDPALDSLEAFVNDIETTAEATRSRSDEARSDTADLLSMFSFDSLSSHPREDEDA